MQGFLGMILCNRRSMSPMNLKILEYILMNKNNEYHYLFSDTVTHINII